MQQDRRRCLPAKLITGHCMRRSGAKDLARKGTPLAKIQWLGRWGSAVVIVRRGGEGGVGNRRRTGDHVVRHQGADCSGREKGPGGTLAILP